MAKKANNQEPKAAPEFINIAEKIWATGWTYIRNIVDTVREPFLILDEDLKVVTANESFYRFFQVRAKETEKQYIYDLGNRQWNIPQLKTLLEEILPKNIFFKDFEVDHDFPAIGHKVMLLNARRVYQDTHVGFAVPALIMLAMEDVTKLRLVEEKLEHYAENLKLEVMEKTHDLDARIIEFEKINKLLIGRENKMIELKKIITALTAKDEARTKIIDDLRKEIEDIREKISK